MPGNEREQIEAELESVEQQWRVDQTRYLVRTADGRLEPRSTTSVPRCIAMMVGSVIGMAFIAASPLPVWTTYIGMFPFGYATFRLMIGSSRAEAFERCRTAYETRRASLQRKLAALAAQGE